MKDEPMNLLEETLEDLRLRGLSATDVRWVGGCSFWFTWDEFAALADQEYDSGYGGQEVAKDLVVVGDHWWMERHEYDGSEWWEFKQLPGRPERHHVPRAVMGADWSTLAEIDQR